jgi:hypothetical protein
MQSRVQGLITEPPKHEGRLVEWGPFIVLSPLREAYEITNSVSRTRKSAVAQITNTIPARIRLAACGDEAAFTRERSTLSCAISALSISSPHGGGTCLSLLVESFIAQVGVLRVPFGGA